MSENWKETGEEVRDEAVESAGGEQKGGDPPERWPDPVETENIGPELPAEEPPQAPQAIEPVPPEVEEPIPPREEYRPEPPPYPSYSPVQQESAPPAYPQPYPYYPQAQQPVPPPQWSSPQQGGYPQQPYGAYPQQPQPGSYPYQSPQQYPPQPAQQYPQSGPYPAYPQAPAYHGAQNPPKKKMSTGLKVFLWIAGILSVAGITCTVLFFAFAASKNNLSPDRNQFFGSGPFNGGGPEEEIPDEEESPNFEIDPPEDEEGEEDRPDVDVTPNTEGIAIQQKPSGATLDAEAVYNRIVTSTVTVAASLTREGQTSESTGTGIIATSDGYIITNSHVVLNSKATKVKVATYDGLEYDAVVVGVDRTTDLAVLKTNDHDFVPAEFGDAAELAVGEWVLAIGNPGGARFSSSLTRGIISGLDREVGKYSEEGMTYIQTDAAINPGNSGGPLVNMYGQVVGINSSKIITEGYEGMGFAIPVSRAQPIINELLSGGYIKGRTRLGIMCREIDRTMAELYGVPRGLQITEVNEESAFRDTEAQPGDIVTAIEGETVETLQDVSNLLLRYAPGDKVSVTLYRPGSAFGQEGTEIQVEITLLEDKGETQN